MSNDQKERLEEEVRYGQVCQEGPDWCRLPAYHEAEDGASWTEAHSVELPASPHDEDGYCGYCGNHKDKAGHALVCYWQDTRDDEAAQARADRDGVKVSAVVRAALEEYVKEGNRGN